MKQQYIYTITDKNGTPFQDICFSRAEARVVRNHYQQRVKEKLSIVRYCVDKKVR